MRLLSRILPLVLIAASLSACASDGAHPPDGSISVFDMSGASDDLGKGGGDGGLLPLAAMCTANAQCSSNVCAPYKNGAYKLCTFQCTALMPAPQCTSPGVGQCNGMGYCKFPGM